jgi:hypothetical protein
MNRILLWFLFGVFTSLALLMVVFGVLFIKDVYVHRAEASLRLPHLRHTAPPGG